MLIADSRCVYALKGGAPEVLLEGEVFRQIVEGRALSAIALEKGEVVVTHGARQRLHSGVQEPIEALLLLEEEPLELLLGTHEAHLYRLRDDGRPARRLEGFEALACRREWHTPWGGPPAVRSLARAGGWVYADIHVGSIMRSSDRGESWEPVKPGLHEDVHQVATASRAPQRVYANTANAVYLSEDRGDSWRHCAGGLAARYGRAIAVHPEDPDCLLATLSRGPHEQVDGRLYRSDDAGRSWTHVQEGFPASTRENIDTFHIAFSADGAAWAVVEKRLYRSADRGAHWEVCWEGPEKIARIAAA